MILNPFNGLSDLTLESQVGTSGYYVPTDTLKLNESDRLEYLYADTSYGGKKSVVKYKLTPIEFICFVYGSTRNEMLARAQALSKAVAAGGTIEITIGSSTTYYTYECSPIPALADITSNKWDAIARAQANYVVALAVTLQTQPYGDSGEYTSKASLVTIDNGGCKSIDTFSGDAPSLLQVTLVPPAATTKMLLSTKTGTLPTYQFEPDGWTETVDVTRTYGHYNSVTLNTYDTDYLPIPTDYEGYVAFFAVVKASTTEAYLKLGARLDSTPVWASSQIYQVEQANVWHIVYLGEYNLPLERRSDSLTDAVVPTLEAWGTAVLDVDSMFILFTEDGIKQVDIELDTGDKVFIEENLATILNASNAQVGRPSSVYGIPLTLNGDGNLIVFSQCSTGYTPADDIVVTVKAKYRTVYPFGS
jgi:hypothetical protein